jgi:hypothetical protein
VDPKERLKHRDRGTSGAGASPATGDTASINAAADTFAAITAVAFATSTSLTASTAADVQRHADELRAYADVFVQRSSIDAL